MDYTVSLTAAEQKAMEYAAYSPSDWIDNVVHNRARIAIDDICREYTNYKLENNEAITAVGKEAMVEAAFEEGIVKSLVDLQAENMAALEAQQTQPE